MTVPLMGAILFPLCFLLWARPDRMLGLLLVAGIFPAASALTLGSVCLQPSLVPGLAFISYVVLQKLLGARYPGQDSASRLCGPMMLATAWALVGSIVMPRLFRNQVHVWPQKQDLVGGQVLLTPTFGNISQDTYLLLNVLLMVLAAQYLTRWQVKLSRLYYAYLAAGWLVVVLCVWQFGSRVGGLPFPKTFFYSNTGWAVLDNQMAGPVPRINATFSEPSACASYLAGILFSTVWVTLKGYKVRFSRLLIAASALGMCLTTSTTGFAAVAVGALLMPIMVVATGAARLLGRIGQLAMICAVLLGVGGLAVATFSPHTVESAQMIASSTAEKKNSVSYQERSQADADSLTAFAETYGLGVGWGSNRSSSLIPGLLATVGAVGVICLAVFDWRLMKSAAWALRAAPGSPETMVVEGVMAALAGRLTAACISGPTIGLPDFYVLIAVAIAAIVRVQMLNRAATAVPVGALLAAE